MAYAGLLFASGKPWLLRGLMGSAETTGLLELRRLCIEPWKHGGEVTGTVFRAIRAAEIRAAVLHELRFLGTEPLALIGGPTNRPLRLFDESERPVRQRLVPAAKPPKKKGRPGKPDAHYEGVALEYLERCENPFRCPTKELAERRGVPYATMRDWVSGARRRGYLGPGRQGRAGATPGPLLLRKRKPNGSRINAS